MPFRDIPSRASTVPSTLLLALWIYGQKKSDKEEYFYHEMLLDLRAEVLLPGFHAEEASKDLWIGVELYRHLHRVPPHQDLLCGRPAL